MRGFGQNGTMQSSDHGCHKGMIYYDLLKFSPGGSKITMAAKIDMLI